MILLSYVRRLAQQPGRYWLVPDSEAAVGALRTYQEGGHSGDGIHHLYATVLGGQRLSPESAINVVTTPSHWIMDLNVRVECSDTGAAGGGPNMAPQAPLLLSPPGALPRPM